MNRCNAWPHRGQLPELVRDRSVTVHVFPPLPGSVNEQFSQVNCAQHLRMDQLLVYCLRATAKNLWATV